MCGLNLNKCFHRTILNQCDRIEVSLHLLVDMAVSYMQG